MSSPQFHIGISGWTYEPWKRNFYPPQLPPKQELAFASRQINSIEINGTFYRLQTPKSFHHWYQVTPKGFMFSVKASRYLTHTTRLRNLDQGLANFLASGLFALTEKLGPILWQFPPNFKYDPALMEDFLTLLPHDTDHAASLARHHTLDAARAMPEPEAHFPLSHVVEIRHDSFKTPVFIDQLRRHNVALVFADTVKWPYMEDVTGDVIYARLHGSEELYVSGYSEHAIEAWAKRFALWGEGREPADARRIGPKASDGRHRSVYVYFDNDVKVHAPFNAQSLARRLNGPNSWPPCDDSSRIDPAPGTR